MNQIQQSEKEKKLSNFIENFVGYDTYTSGLCHYVNNQNGELREINSCNLPEKLHLNDVRVVAISDTHERHKLLSLPKGDVLLHCGDALMLNSGYRRQVSINKLHDFNRWLSTTHFKERVFIAGNHDQIIETLGKERTKKILSHCHFLEHEHVTLDCGLTIFGTPCSIANTHRSANRAFQYSTKIVENIFKKVSPKIDILMTHGPLHSLPPAQCFLKSNPTIPFSFCGHVHEEHGSTIYNGNHINVNASIMANVKNKFSPSNPPIVLDIPFSKISLESSL
jgi:hypothetical protein